MSENERRELKGFLMYMLFMFVFSLLVVVYPLFSFHFNLSDQVDSSTMNGMIAVIAILFGFVSFEAREIKSLVGKTVFLVSLVLFLIVTSDVYFSDIIQFGHATKVDLIVAMVNLSYNALNYLTIIHFKNYEQKSLSPS